MVGNAKHQYSRILNEKRQPSARDFQFSIYSFAFMLAIFGVFVLVYHIAGRGHAPSAPLLRCALGLVAGSLVYLLFARWAALIPSILIAQVLALLPLAALEGKMLSGGILASPLELIPIVGMSLALLSAPSFQVVVQWDKVVVLRLGKFLKVANPGPFFLLPLVDRCAAFVDTRIRVTDFSAEKILTQDTVPVHIDALAFWMIWDAQKAILEVEDFLEAVTLSAQTALRDSIGKYSLTTLLSERETLYREIQSILDAKTNPWGVTILSVEFTDIVLPSELEDVMSRQAQAEREKASREFLAKAEREIAREFEAAAEVYRDNPTALNLRAMNMVYDGIKNNGSLVLLPSSALEGMNLGSTLGIQAAAKKMMGDKSPEEDS